MEKYSPYAIEQAQMFVGDPDAWDRFQGQGGVLCEEAQQLVQDAQAWVEASPDERSLTLFLEIEASRLGPTMRRIEKLLADR